MSKDSQIIMNQILLRSIPIDKDLKRYYISKYKHLCRHHGISFATRKMKDLLICLKTYKSTGVIHNPGVRRNGWFIKLLHYVDCQPQFAFNFLACLAPIGNNADVKDKAPQFSKKLEAIKDVDKRTPEHLGEFLRILRLPRNLMIKEYWLQRNTISVKMSFHRYTKHHSLSEWMQYWSRQRRVYFNMNDLTNKVQQSKPTFPELYSDFIAEEGSKTHKEDVHQLVELFCIRGVVPPCIKSHIEKFLSREFLEAIDGPDYSEVKQHHFVRSIRAAGKKVCVGNIHFVKKGSDDLRPIAVPNRYLQSPLVPIYNRLESIVKKTKVDATFDQQRFDNSIVSRVRSDDFYVGCVDLKSATEYLPLDWISNFMGTVVNSSLERFSWVTFIWLSRQEWKLQGCPNAQWYVGQPLGTLPSFMVLAVTHALYLESLSLKCGYGHSPYRILGDDVVFFAKRLRQQYIDDLQSRGVPISLNKSFAGKLVEFAGKCFVKKGTPFYIPDSKVLTWESLFDWQVATGIPIPFRLLPRDFRKKINRKASTIKNFSCSGDKLYRNAQTCCVYPRGTSNIQLSKRDGKLLTHYFSYFPDEAPSPEGVNHSGVVLIDNIVTSINKRSIEVNGYFKRFEQATLPNWFKNKFRPVGTDAMFDIVIKATSETWSSIEE